MIANESDFEQAVEQIGRMYRALAALRAEVLLQSRQQFALMAEGPLEEIRRLQADLSDSIETLSAPSDVEPPSSEEASAA